jgi:hypothetical protein
MDNTLLLILGVAVAIFVVWLIGSSKRSNYRYLQSLDNPREGGYYAEYNEECLDAQNQNCHLTDGTTGVCVLHGLCQSSPLVDLRQEDDDTPKPDCLPPVFKQGCGRYCNCLKLRGDDYPGCMNDCASDFSPL